MNEAETWAALIGLFTMTATMFGFTWRLVTQSLDSRFGEFAARLDVRFAHIDSRFAQVDSRFEQLEGKLDLRFDLLDQKVDFRCDALDQKIDEVGRRTSILEDDVRAITRHLFDGPEAA